MKLSHKTQWLENLPLSTLQTLMARYALRAFPAIVQRYESTTFHEDHFLKHARSLLSAVCLIAKPSEELRIAAVFAAANARQAGHDVDHSAASLAAVAAARSLVLRRGDEAKHEILSSIETLPFSDFAEQAQWDYGKISSASENPAISHSPLWTIELQHFEAARQIDTPNDRKLQKRLSFWREWYQGFLDGKPLDWELQRRVALIDDTIWDAGPETVAAEIERIRSLFELEQEIANLKGQLTAVQNTPAAALIGDNGGPPLEDAPARAFQTDLALIWKQVEELEEEIAKPSPSLSHLEKIAKALWDISLRMTAYCGSIADGMIREGSKELAKAGAKWTARATAVTVTAQTEGVQSVVKAIGAFVKTLQ
ncbi:hypothetical protein K4F84_11520 [Phaeobacter inhibens]|uniref:hypothetical protein n=1 Tax=Phaeobacter inhibens TaxID=221822 RepID=UPI0021A66968|nr:hypothetical protein [Phaeobacter inhibens]UWR51839.1 hypothetical protein K4F84_11520 [Phaeobacter inhibens]UWR67414.1 hypothetical protein K4K95_11715 [Phaeobacter inhibens]